MGDPPQGPYGLLPPGQPAPLRDGEWSPASRVPRLFGGGYRELAGKPRVIQVQTPLVASQWKYTHSGPSWFYLACAVATYVTDATVASRNINFLLTFNGVVCGAFAPVIQQTASQSFIYNLSPSAPSTASAGISPVAIPDNLVLADNMSLSSVVAGGGVGDQWSLIALYAYEFTDACL